MHIIEKLISLHGHLNLNERKTPRQNLNSYHDFAWEVRRNRDDSADKLGQCL